MVAAPKIPMRMDIADVLDGTPRDGRIWQLFNDMPLAMAPPSRSQSAIQSEISGLLRNHLLEQGSACSVVTTPGIAPRVPSEHNVRIPDLAVTCSPGDVEEVLLKDPVVIEEGDIVLGSIGFTAKLRSFYRTTRLAR